MATRTSLMDFQIPRIVSEEGDDHRGVFAIEPLDRGFGYTFGNSLRRVLLSSLEGAAVTAVKIEGIAHEFTTLPGVREDVTDLILNLKSLICRLHGESPEIEVHISKKGPGAITAADIEAPADLEILNPELEIAHLADKGKLEMTLTIGRGRGYVPAELNRGPEMSIGVIPIDSIFSPVRRVAYEVEAARVGQRTDYDKLVLDVTTDGSIEPRDAIAEAAEILIRQLAIFTDLDRIDTLHDPSHALFLALAIRSHDDVGRHRRLVGIGNPGEVLDLSATRLLVESLDVSLLAHRQRAVDIHFKEAADELARALPRPAVRRDRGRDRDHARPVLEQREVRDPPDILVAVFPREPEPRRQPRPDLVAVQDHDRKAAGPDPRLEEAGQGALPRRGQAGEPHSEFLLHESRQPPKEI